MPKAKTKIEHQLLREFRELSAEGKGEVFQYAEWMRDLEIRQKEVRKNCKEQKKSSLD